MTSWSVRQLLKGSKGGGVQKGNALFQLTWIWESGKLSFQNNSIYLIEGLIRILLGSTFYTTLLQCATQMQPLPG